MDTSLKSSLDHTFFHSTILCRPFLDSKKTEKEKYNPLVQKQWKHSTVECENENRG